MKTRQEVEDLKAQWAKDPSWDIENTEGFEKFKEELIGHRTACEARWERGSFERAMATARKWGITLQGIDQRLFGEQMEQLVSRIENLEKKTRMASLL